MGEKLGRKPAEVIISDEDREFLESLIRKSSAPQAQVLRAKIALMCADGKSNGDISRELDTTEKTVSKWRLRFSRYGVATLSDAPRSGTPRTITDEMVTKVIAATLETKPEGATHWSTYSLAKELGMTQNAIFRIWRTFGLKPYLVQYFNISTDPEFTEKVRDVVGLYLNPPDAALVLCLDEKTQIQALDRTQPILPLRPFVPERQTHDYARHGTTNLYAALSVASGKVITKTTDAHRAVEFISFLEEINRQVPKELDVHVILDNYAAHKTQAVKEWLLKHPRFHFHFTPTYSSWMNLVERWFGELTSKALRRSTHKSEKQLIATINAWTAHWNENPRPYKWIKTADEIFESISRFLNGTSQLGH